MASDQAPSDLALRLAANLDLRAAGPLAAELLAIRGVDVALDAAEVRRLGGQCLQVLLAAEAAWSDDQKDFRIVNASPDFCEACALMGVERLAEDRAAPELNP